MDKTIFNYFSQVLGLGLLIRLLLSFLFLLGCISSLSAASKKPLKIFILAGQSNMQGHAKITTLEHLGMDSATKPWLEQLQGKGDKPKVFKKIHVSYLTTSGLKEGPLTTGFGADESKFGPELGFGMTLDKALDQEILIIKAAWGGKSLFQDFRPPSSGLYQGDAKATGHYYRLTLNHIKDVLANLSRVCPKYDKSAGYELAGFVWFQGWNDMVNGGVYPNRNEAGGYDEYTKLMAQFIRDIRSDLSAPKLPFVIGVMGAGGPVKLYPASKKRYAGIHQNFRNAMAAPAKLAEFKNNVVPVYTETYWDNELSNLKIKEQEINSLIKKQQKENKWSNQEANKRKEELRKKEFSKSDLAKMKVGISNAEFHYLGAGKILVGIGTGFAEALLKMKP